MSETKFIVREGHFHISDKDKFVLTGWFDRESGQIPETNKLRQMFRAFADRKRLEVCVRSFSDDSVRQKYAKFDMKITREYVVIVTLPPKLSGYRRVTVCLADGTRIYERSMKRLKKLQGQLDCRITDMQSTGAGCVLGGWAASQRPVTISVLDHSGHPLACEVSHFPRPDVALEHREAETLSDSGFSITVPVNGREKMTLQMTDGVNSVTREFRALDRNKIGLYLRKAHYFMRRNGMVKTYKRAVNELYELVGDTGNYMKWRKKNMPSEKELLRQRQEHSTFRPLIYLVTPYQDIVEQGARFFEETAASVIKQTYTNWKWVIACTEAEKETVKQIIRRQFRGYAASRTLCGQGYRAQAKQPESRIILVNATDQDRIERKTARAVKEAAARMQKQAACMNGRETAQGRHGADADHAPYAQPWMAFLSSADTLEPDALYSCVKLWEQNPKTDLCYTDEDQVSGDGTLYSSPVFKSDFNIDMLRGMYYTGHMLLLRADTAAKAGLWDPRYGADAAYDYVIRAAEAAACIGHLARVVYHKRALDGERKQAHTDTENTRALQAADALNAHYRRQNLPARAEESQVPGIYHTVYTWNEQPLVSVLIPNKDHIEDLDTCIQSVLTQCTYPNYEIVIVENNSTQDSTFAYYKKIQEQDSRIRVIYWKYEYNYSKINNFGVTACKGEYILLLNNDTEVISPDFMEEMLGYCMRADVGVCGARLFYFDDTIQHAGVVIGLGGICGEGFQGFAKENGGYLNRIVCPQDYSAVTAACMMTKKSVFEQVGGLDEELQIAYNDIDYCLKVRSSGKLVVYNPFAVLHHYEYKSRGVENTAEKLARYNREVDLFTSRWADLIGAGDPYYNPNLTRRYQDFSLRRIELLK